MNHINFFKNKTQILSLLSLGYLLSGFTSTTSFQTDIKNLQMTPKTIYGTDNRTEAVKSSKLTLAKSTVALIDSSMMYQDENYLKNKKTNFYRTNFKTEFNLCSNQKFLTQPVIAFCSGSLIGKNLVLTAGHCITNEEECQNARFVFDYRMSSGGLNPTSTVEANLYSCKKIVSSQFGDKINYTIVELDRDVVNRTPIQLELNSDLAVNEAVFMIGHPSGLPTKVIPTGVVRTTQPEYFISNLDGFGGNSGSPIFNKYNRQVGVLVKGPEEVLTDYYEDNVNFCVKTKICKANECAGEKATNVKAIFNNLPAIALPF